VRRTYSYWCEKYTRDVERSPWSKHSGSVILGISFGVLMWRIFRMRIEAGRLTHTYYIEV
jgi:hypothetical protein